MQIKMLTIIKNIICITSILIYVKISQISGSDVTKKDSINKVYPSPAPVCPRGCTCDSGPLRASPFVLTWMTSWGEEDLPRVHPNDVLDPIDISPSTTAADADVDVDVVGKHVTCAIQPMTSLPRLLSSLPADTMVLTLLQAPGCNYTVLEGGQFLSLHNLKALHIQGYAYRDKSQISGFKPGNNQDDERNEELRIKAEQMKHINLVLTEDALDSLQNLQLLDLQFVRILAERDARRLRRFSNLHPISHTTLLDLPVSEFIKLTERLSTEYNMDSSLLKDPQYLKITEKFKTNAQNMKSNSKMTFYDDEDYTYTDSGEYDDSSEEINYISNYIDDSNSNDDILFDDVVSYDVYQANTEPQLAPFKTLLKLRYLRVAHAKLDRIGPELLQGLEKIHTLTLEHNDIKVIPDDMFSLTPGLRHLSIAHNRILEINDKSLSGLINLLTLDLNNNELSIIGSFDFPVLPVLATIRLNENPITRVLHDAFVNVNATENLYIGSVHHPSNVDNNAFRGLNALKTLVINNINLFHLSKTFIPIAPTLEKLTLHGNISGVDFDSFSETPNLKHLDLSNCNIDYVSIDAFFNLAKLKYLNLSHNKIEDLDPGTFDHLFELYELYLHDNQLTTLPPGIFLPIPVQLVHVYNNPWDCSCDLVQLKPIITNKIKRRGYIECQWDDKLAAICKSAPDKVVYDSRVAPLCVTPPRLQGQDVFHSAIRYLNCSKDIKKPKKVVKSSQAPSTTPAIVKDSRVTKPHKPNLYLPLIAYTPPIPKPKDLYEIAQEEGLVELKDDQLSTPSLLNILNPKSPPQVQNDQQFGFSEERLKKKFEMRRLEKNKIKKQMKERKLKEKLAEKARIDALLNRNTKQQSYYKSKLGKFTKMDTKHKYKFKKDSKTNIKYKNNSNKTKFLQSG